MDCCCSPPCANCQAARPRIEVRILGGIEVATAIIEQLATPLEIGEQLLAALMAELGLTDEDFVDVLGLPAEATLVAASPVWLTGPKAPLRGRPIRPSAWYCGVLTPVFTHRREPDDDIESCDDDCPCRQGGTIN